ncbi:hypothetical protein Taro_043800 [Colocasia esculenta]|uniref:Elongator complex protein 4 n=1 Tax=Colocasia esculenta TaxID=4460 RepID=A0A843X1E7_COLES|nr:hypothetical protein [Colocasia esculenta]
MERRDASSSGGAATLSSCPCSSSISAPERGAPRKPAMAAAASSFRRNLNPSASWSSASMGVTGPGIKRGLNAAAYISSGIPDLDVSSVILGGGFLLGSLVMIMEDTEAPHHLLLLRNFMAQGLVHRQPLLFASTAEPRAFLGTLPSPMPPPSLPTESTKGGGPASPGLGGRPSAATPEVCWQSHLCCACRPEKLASRSLDAGVSVGVQGWTLTPPQRHGD